MSQLRASGQSNESSNDDHSNYQDESQGYQILSKYFRTEAAQSNSAFSKKNFDTYRGMIQLRELLRGGEITKSDYEAAKHELLFEE